MGFIALVCAIGMSIACITSSSTVDLTHCEETIQEAGEIRQAYEKMQRKIAAESPHYRDFFQEMEAQRNEALPASKGALIAEAIQCELARPAPDLELISGLLVAGISRKPGTQLLDVVSQIIEKVRRDFVSQEVTSWELSTFRAALYLQLFAKTEEAMEVLNQAIREDFWMDRNTPRSEHPNASRILQARMTAAGATAALEPERAITFLEAAYEMLPDDEKDTQVYGMGWRIHNRLREMRGRKDGEDPRSMSSYYHVYSGPGAPIR